jgi:hypothetical protein
MSPGELNDKIEKLPKWAQDHIRHLGNIIERKTLKISELTDLPDSPFKHTVESLGPYVNLPERHSVRIEVANGSWVDFRLCDHDPNRIYLMANRGMMVQSCSHNTLEIVPEPEAWLMRKNK